MVVAKSVAVAADALLVAAGVAGCAARAPALGIHTAEVTINGHDAGRAHPVACNQFGWDWKIETLDEAPGFTAMFETGNTIDAESVEIRELGGFTGSYLKYTVGEAEAGTDLDAFTITGTAVGYTYEQPDERTSATFAIKTDC